MQPPLNKHDGSFSFCCQMLLRLKENCVKQPRRKIKQNQKYFNEGLKDDRKPMYHVLYFAYERTAAIILSASISESLSSSSFLPEREIFFTASL